MNICKKAVVMGLIILFSINSLTILQSEAGEESDVCEETLTIVQNFSPPEISHSDDHLKISVAEAEYYTTEEETPMLPCASQTFEFPFGTNIIDISFSLIEINVQKIEGKIKQAPQKQRTDGFLQQENADYSNINQYPLDWISYSSGSGLDKNNNHILILSLHIYPVIYFPQEDLIHYLSEIKISITYETLQTNLGNSDIYDLLIITPAEFSENIQPLLNHKENYTMKTTMMLLEDIYSICPGRDMIEQIKYCIKQAIEEWDIHYVLLIGDVKKLPIRKTYASWWEPDLLSDLYYADVYNASYEFCSWDANENNLFGEIELNGVFPPDMENVDDVDLYPDVHLGRLACSTPEEVDHIVQRIITYETWTYDQIWFKRIVLAGGDTFPPAMGALPFIYEGEIATEKVAQQLPDFKHIKLWASCRNLNALTFNWAISKGAGFVSYSGHGFEHGWGTYHPNSIRRKIGLYQPLYYTPFLKFLKNQQKLPIVFFDACLTAKLDFNITDLDEYYPSLIRLLLMVTNMEYDPSEFFPCFAWSFLTQENGGAIATVGATRTAYTMVDKDGVYGGAGYLNVHFFKAYEEGIHLGEMLTTTQNDYISNVGHDFFTIEEFLLLGDPSLMVGGYPN